MIPRAAALTGRPRKPSPDPNSPAGSGDGQNNWLRRREHTVPQPDQHPGVTAGRGRFQPLGPDQFRYFSGSTLSKP